MNLQTRYDLEVAEDEIAAKVARDVQPLETVTARGLGRLDFASAIGVPQPRALFHDDFLRSMRF